MSDSFLVLLLESKNSKFHFPKCIIHLKALLYLIRLGQFFEINTISYIIYIYLLDLFSIKNCLELFFRNYLELFRTIYYLEYKISKLNQFATIITLDTKKYSLEFIYINFFTIDTIDNRKSQW